jgi:ATP-dependent Clp protease ATP-binding subunit ClpX
MNASVAQIGVVALDEIDKIALQQSSARYAGEGTTKDVKGNVQKELLQILGGSDVAVPVGHTSDYGRSVPMSTRDIGFVAAGAFSELKELAARRHAARIGFAGSPEPAAAADVTATEEIDVELLQEYGFLPEFTARFGRAVRLAPLTPDELRTILHDNILPPLVREFELEGVALEFGPAQTERFIEQALARKTGARGLRAAVEHYVEDLAFERFGETRKQSTKRAPRAKRKPRDAGRESP